jgi:hypothetical protein
VAESVAYLQTTKVTHICIWVQSSGQVMSSGRTSYNYRPATLCGWKKENFKSTAKVLYTLLGEVPRFPICQTCAQVAVHAAKLSALNDEVAGQADFEAKIPEENTDAGSTRSELQAEASGTTTEREHQRVPADGGGTSR